MSEREPRALAALRASDLLEVAAARLALSLALLASGFRAVSDDDYARVTIAQTWALAPRLDPSGTSWLPFPFWLHGAVMLVAGRSLLVAQIVTVLLGVAASLLVAVAAHRLTRDRRAARLAAHFATLVGWSAWLGVATVPELFTAALTLAAASNLASRAPAPRAWGALALLAATLSRYEPWPIAFVFAAWNLATPPRPAPRAQAKVEAPPGAHPAPIAATAMPPSAHPAVIDATAMPPSAHPAPIAAFPRRLAVSLLALAGPLLWIAWNRATRGDAFDFLARVTAYHRALAAPAGAATDTVFARLLAYPLAITREMPEVVVPALLLAALALHPRLRPPLAAALRRHAAPLFLAAFQLAALAAALVNDGAPTHHPERAALFPALALALFVADAALALSPLAAGSSTSHWISGAVSSSRAPAALTQLRRSPFVRWLGAGLMALLAARALSTPALRPEAFNHRDSELAMGAHLAATLAPSARVSIEATGYGYFALQAASGRPEQLVLDRDLDPRHPAPPPTFPSETAHAAWLRAHHFTHLLAARPAGSPAGLRFSRPPRFTTAGHALFDVPP